MSQVYYGRDPYLIAYLRMRGNEEIGKEKDGGQVIILFKDTPQLQRDMDDYFTCTASGPLKHFADAVRDVFREFRNLKNGKGNGNGNGSDEGDGRK